MSEGDLLRSLVTSITHDLNNTLTALLGNISLASMMTGPDRGEVGKILADAEVSARRMRLVVEQLKMIPDVVNPPDGEAGAEEGDRCVDPAAIARELLQVAPCTLVDLVVSDHGKPVAVHPEILRLVLCDLFILLLKAFGEHCRTDISIGIDEAEGMRMRIVAVPEDGDALAAFSGYDRGRLDLLVRLLSESGCSLVVLADGENGFELLMPLDGSPERAR